jgi:hypothetical protein
VATEIRIITPEQAQRFAHLFRGRSDTFSILPPPFLSGGNRIAGKLSIAIHRDHLTGLPIQLPLKGNPVDAFSLAVYPSVPPDNHCFWACADIDEENRESVIRLIRVLHEMGLEAVAEVSKGKGMHLWVFFTGPVSSARARALLREARRRAGNPPGEDYPKTLVTPSTPWGVPVNLPYSPTAPRGRRVGIDLDAGALLTLDEFLDRAEAASFSPEQFEEVWFATGLPEPPLVNADEDPFPIHSSEARTLPEGMRFPFNPCARKLLASGASQGQRNSSAFRLAIHHKLSGFPIEEAMAELLRWNRERNSPSLTEKELADTVRSAFRSSSATLGCEEEPFRSLCERSCPVYLNQHPEELREWVEALRANQRTHAETDEGTENVNSQKSDDGAEMTDSSKSEGREETVNDAPDFNRSDLGRPAVPPLVWSGFLADYRKTLAPTTEAPEAYFLGVGLALMGEAVGRRSWVQYGDRLFPNWFVLLLGDSGVDRKSHCLKKGQRLLSETLSEIRVLDAISSAEGFLQAMTDFKPGDDPPTAEDPLDGIPTLLVVEEFTAILKKALQKATGNITELLRNAYDNLPMLSVPTRQNSLWVKDPYLCLISATTPDDLGTYMTLNDAANGFGNRFAYFSGPRDGKPRPLPPSPSPAAWESLKLRLMRLRNQAQGEMLLSKEAQDRWEDHYIRVLFPRGHQTGRLSQLTQRVAQFAMKAALLYALDRGVPAIETEDIERGIALSEYLVKTACYVAGELAESQEVRYERKIIKALQQIGPATRPELRRKIGGSNVPTLPYNRIMDALVKEGTVLQRGAFFALADQAETLDGMMGGANEQPG